MTALLLLRYKTFVGSLKKTKKKRYLVILGVKNLTTEGRGSIFKLNDGRRYLYIPTKVSGDSVFPFKCEIDQSIFVKIAFVPGTNKVTIEKWTDDK